MEGLGTHGYCCGRGTPGQERGRRVSPGPSVTATAEAVAAAGGLAGSVSGRRWAGDTERAPPAGAPVSMDGPRVVLTPAPRCHSLTWAQTKERRPRDPAPRSRSKRPEPGTERREAISRYLSGGKSSPTRQS